MFNWHVIPVNKMAEVKKTTFTVTFVSNNSGKEWRIITLQAYIRGMVHT